MVCDGQLVKDMEVPRFGDTKLPLVEGAQTWNKCNNDMGEIPKEISDCQENIFGVL